MALIPRVILAGGKASPELEKVIGSPVRALARVRGATLLETVVGAVRAADRAAPVTVVGDVPPSAAYDRIADAGDIVSNIVAGVSAHSQADWVLLVSCDLPFLDGDTVARFTLDALTQAAVRRADLVYPVVPVAACYEQYPGIKRTAIRIREGEYTGGNIMLARPAFLLDRKDILRRAYAARKEPLRLAWILGLGTAVRLVLSQAFAPGMLDIPTLEQRAGRVVGGTVTALVCNLPEIATDLDRPADFGAADTFTVADAE